MHACMHAYAAHRDESYEERAVWCDVELCAVMVKVDDDMFNRFKYGCSVAP